MISSPSDSKSSFLQKAYRLFRGSAGYGRLLSVPFVVLVYGFLAYRLYRDRQQLGAIFQQLDFTYLILSGVLLFGALGIVAGRWFFTLRYLHLKVGWWKSLRIWFLSQAGRYIPGGIWPYVGRLYWGLDTMPAEMMVTSMVLETVLRVSSEAVWAAVALLLWRLAVRSGSGWSIELRGLAAAVVITQLVLVLAGPQLWRFLAGRLKVKVPRLPLADNGWKNHLGFAGLWCYYAASVLVVGIAFYFLVAAFVPIGPEALLPLTGSLAAATVIGFLVPFAPNGWGVRDGILALLLARLMPAPTAVVIALASRVWLAVVEGLWVLALSPASRLTDK